MDPGLGGKCVVVTGASGGIGAACARAFAAEGARVAVHYHRGRDRAESLADEIGGAPILNADLTIEDDVDRLFEAAREALGRVDVCAAVLVPMLSRTPWPGTDGNQSCGCGDCGAGDEDTPALFSMRAEEREGYSWMTRPSMPPATVTTWPVTCPDSSSDASTTTWRATSSGCATLRSAIVREIARTRSGST